MKRYVIEGEWSGYRSGQRAICHRRVFPQKRAEKFATITRVQFTDGTTMTVTIRPAEHREKVKEIPAYDTLLQNFLDLGMSGFCRVADLIPQGGAK